MKAIAFANRLARHLSEKSLGDMGAELRLEILDAINGAQKALKYIEKLEKLDIWGFEDVPMQELLRPMSLSVIDLAGVDYVSSAGLRVILLAGKRLKAGGGRLALAGLRDNVREVFEMSGFLTLFPVLPTVDAALVAA